MVRESCAEGDLRAASKQWRTLGHRRVVTARARRVGNTRATALRSPARVASVLPRGAAPDTRRVKETRALLWETVGSAYLFIASCCASGPPGENNPARALTCFFRGSVSPPPNASSNGFPKRFTKCSPNLVDS